MWKRRNYVRMISFIMSFALLLTSAGMPSVTAEAAKNVKVRKVQITSPKKASITLNKGESLKLKVKVTPKNAKNRKVTYKSSDKKIVKVTSKGKITALRNGKAKITVTAKDGSRKKDTINVSVVTPVSKGKTVIATAALDESRKNTPDISAIQNTISTVVRLKKIEITTTPDKITYQEGDLFDPAGMVVTAVYSDGSQKEITDYTYDTGALSALDQTVEISYTENKITRKAEVRVMVQAEDQLVSIRYQLKKTELEREGAHFTDDDIAITAKFESGETKQISIADCKVNPDGFSLETTSATITYAYGVKKRTVKVTGFTVRPYRERYTFEDKDTVGTIVKRANENADAVPTEDNAKDITLRFEEGLSGNALRMDGTYGLRLDKIAGTDSKSYSVSVWVKPDSLKDNQALLISTANKFGLQDNLPQSWCAVAGANSTGGIKLWSYNNGWGVAAESQISIGEWNHIVLVVDGSASSGSTALGTLYVNGRKAGSGTVRNEKNADMKTYLGVTGWKNDGYYAGLVDDLVFTNEVLTQEEAESYYLEHFADRADKVITGVSTDKAEIEVDYGTSRADVIKALAGLNITGSISDGTKTAISNSEELWTVKDYAEGTEGTVTAQAKIPVPNGYVFQTDGRVSMWNNLNVSVSVKEKGVLESIRITAMPDRTNYMIGQTFDKTGMTVKAVYSNGGELDVTDSIVVDEAAEFTQLGEQSVKVSYTEEEIEKTIDVAVKVLTLEGITFAARTAYYTFDNTLQNSVDTSKSAVTAVNQRGHFIANNDSPVYAVSGVKDGCIELDGNSPTAIKLAESIAAEDKNFTINFWVNPRSVSDTNWNTVIMGNNGDKQLVIYENPAFNGTTKETIQLQGTYGNGAVNLQDVLPIGQWTMLTWVNKEDGVDFYVNGTAQEVNGNLKVTTGLDEIVLGASLWDTRFDGFFDEVSIYNESLNAEQVKILYDQINTPVAE